MSAAATFNRLSAFNELQALSSLIELLEYGLLFCSLGVAMCAVVALLCAVYDNWGAVRPYLQVVARAISEKYASFRVQASPEQPCDCGDCRDRRERSFSYLQVVARAVVQAFTLLGEIYLALVAVWDAGLSICVHNYVSFENAVCAISEKYASFRVQASPEQPCDCWDCRDRRLSYRQVVTRAVVNYVTVNCQLICTPAGIAACLFLMAIFVAEFHVSVWLWSTFYV